MKGYGLKFSLLSFSSAALLSAGFIFPHCGAFSLIAFLPLLLMDRMATAMGIREIRFFGWYYLTFLLWNAFTTFWVCNATLAGGIAAMICNALFTSVLWALFRLSKRRFASVLPYIFLPLVWIAWERFYFSAEVSWPWLTLGNAFATTTTCIQWYELTGLLGGSLWIWLCNLSVFGLVCALDSGRWKSFNSKARVAAITAATLFFLGPLAASWVRYASFTENKGEGSLDAVAIQPNFDPYEKFVSLSRPEQNDILLKMMEKSCAGRDTLSPLLFVAPETFTDDLILNDLHSSSTLMLMHKYLQDFPNRNIIFGASTYDVIQSPEPPSYTARPFGKDAWYENHNSAVLADGSHRTEIYHKSRLVVGTELMPWPPLFSRIEKLLGGNIMGHCVGQAESANLTFRCNLPCNCKDCPVEVPVGCAVCYESVYPEYFASYVKKGAQIMSVITNDAWWGDTPGYRQHMSYSRLRAIETRRDIVRSANTGISCFINQRGDVVSQTPWWERSSLEGRLYRNSSITPFVRYGDVVGRLCSFAFLLMLCALIVKILTGQDRPSNH